MKRENRLDREKIVYLLKKHKKKLALFAVKRIGLFGSYVKGTQKEESNIDFIVEFEEGKKNFDNFINLAFLEEIFWEKG